MKTYKIAILLTIESSIRQEEVEEAVKLRLEREPDLYIDNIQITNAQFSTFEIKPK